MASTYDPTLPTNLDWVRYLIRDVVVATPLFSDEEIAATIVEVTPGSKAGAIKYLAAVILLKALHRDWMTRGRGAASKKIGRLSIAYGTGAGINVDAALQSN